MTSDKGAASLELAREMLRKNNDVTYAEVRAKAESKGLPIYPIMYGRAKALEGLVKVAPRGSGKQAKAKAKAMAMAKRGPGRPPKAKVGRPPKRGPGRPRKQANVADALGSVVAAIKDNAQATERYRRALERMSEILNEALGS